MKNLSDYEIFEEVCTQLPNMSLCEKNIVIDLIFTRVQRKRNH